jgi:hypothetical protein
MRQCGTAVRLDRIIRRPGEAAERAALARVSPCRASCVGDIDHPIVVMRALRRAFSCASIDAMVA